MSTYYQIYMRICSHDCYTGGGRIKKTTLSAQIFTLLQWGLNLGPLAEVITKIIRTRKVTDSNLIEKEQKFALPPRRVYISSGLVNLFFYEGGGKIAARAIFWRRVGKTFRVDAR